MSRVRRLRSLAVTVTALAAVLPPVAATGQATAAVPAAQATAGDRSWTQARISTAYELPGDRVYPEGIAADPYTGDLYAGSYADGTVYRTTPGRRVAEIFLRAGADGRDTANGVKVDRFRRLWVTDSTTGVSVYDTRTRRLLAHFDLPGQGAGSFVNDLAIAPDGSAYLTDSIRAVVYRVTPGQLARAKANDGRGLLASHFDLGGIRDPQTPAAFTLNGIVADPAGRYLLTVDMTGGDLYRLDLRSGTIRKVALRGDDMLNADGLELRHGRLWAAHNTTNTISRWRITENGFAARVERRVTDKALQIPTTLVHRGGTLYVVRSQFDKGGPMGPGTPQIPFTIAAVRGI